MYNNCTLIKVAETVHDGVLYLTFANYVQMLLITSFHC